MHPDRPTDRVSQLWQEQILEGRPMVLDEVRNRVAVLERAVRWRNGSEYAAGVLGLAVIARALPALPNVVFQIGAVMLALGAVYVAYNLHRRTSARTLPAALGITEAVAFHRAELLRHLDALRSVQRWYLLPFVPGMATILIAALIEHPEQWASRLAVVPVWVLLHWWILRMNERAAVKVEREIGALDALR